MRKHTIRHQTRSKKRHRHSKSHRHSKRHIRRHSKRRGLVLLPGSQSVPIFTPPQKKHTNKIVVNEEHIQSGNIISGLRDYIKNM